MSAEWVVEQEFTDPDGNEHLVYYPLFTSFRARYVVRDSSGNVTSMEEFRGETAHHQALRRFTDVILPIAHGGRW